MSSISTGWNSAHNSIGIILFNVGIIGTIIFLIMIYKLLQYLMQTYTKESVLIYAAIFGFMISGIVSGALGGTAFWFLASVGFSISSNSNLNNNSRKHKLRILRRY